MRNRSLFSGALVTTGLLAGTLDAIAAVLHTYLASGRGFTTVFQFVASGVLGTDAFQGGFGVALFGLGLHYVIAMGWTFLFFLVYSKLRPAASPLLLGTGYGLAVWTLMNFVVLPLSQVPTLPFRPTSAAIAAGIIVVAIGWPIAWGASRYYKGSAA